MQFKRMFSTDAYKGTRGYLRTQKNYEILRTVLYFVSSLSLFIAGWVSTGSREKLCGQGYIRSGTDSRLERRDFQRTGKDRGSDTESEY